MTIVNRKQNMNFPAPPSGKSGWPWTEEYNHVSPTMPDGNPWPKISIVTPSFNQGKFLEETIRSILLQNYPNLEYFIIDGGSTDDSIEIIKKYEPWLTYWVSEKDRGQAHAINKGLRLCTGKIFNWINSDDYLTRGALRIIAEKFKGNDALAGAVLNFTDSFKFPVKTPRISTKFEYHQPGLWLKTDYLREIGGVIETLRYCFDWHMIAIYLNRFPKIECCDDIFVNFRVHGASKTVSEKNKVLIEQFIVSALLLKEDSILKNHNTEMLLYSRKLCDHIRIESIRADERGNSATKMGRILYDIWLNIFQYPYRHALGVVKRALLKIR